MNRVFLLYHFFHPDDVISARLFSDLAIEFVNNGYEVIACPSNRSCHLSSKRFPKTEQWEGGLIRRIWRPNLRQSSNLGRLLNTVFMLIGWTWLAMTFKRSPRNSQETVVIGTDPIFGLLASISWRLFRPRSKIIHWCHDVHPEATLADGTMSEKSLVIRVLRSILRFAYQRCDVVVDLGSCMKRLLSKAADLKENESNSCSTTITPWSLIEPDRILPPDVVVRSKLFGECKLALLYSGNLGRAHDAESFLKLARICRNDRFHFCFAARGQGVEALKSLMTQDDTNVTFAGFAEESELLSRLSACDVHLVSLKEQWTGTVVPSKFFGALSNGRPVLFSGSTHSCIAGWISEHDVGWNLDACNPELMREKLVSYSKSTTEQTAMQLRCWSVYQEHFSKASQLAKWIKLADSLGASEKS